MLIHALISSVRADPEPTVLALLNRFDKELAHLVCGGALVALLRQDDGTQLFFVPVR